MEKPKPRRSLVVWDKAQKDLNTLDNITRRIANGDTLREICDSSKWPYDGVCKWIAETKGGARAYSEALSMWADTLAQETIGIADGIKNETVQAKVSAAKVRIDTRLKIASRLNRDRYGEAPTVTVNAQSGSLVSILSALPPPGAPEEEPRPAIDVTPIKVQKERVIPMELRDKEVKTSE